MTDTEFKQFLSDVMTAAGLVAHGKQSKALAERLGERVMKLYATPPSAPNGWQLVNSGALQMVVNALRRDAEEGRVIRGEMADELLKAAPKPEDTK